MRQLFGPTVIKWFNKVTLKIQIKRGKGMGLIVAVVPARI